jgi:hypothetical protein
MLDFKLPSSTCFQTLRQPNRSPDAAAPHGTFRLTRGVAVKADL